MFSSWLSAPSMKRKLMAFPSDKNDEQRTSSRIFCPTKICLVMCYQLFCGKFEAAVYSYFVENLLFSKLLNILKRIQMVGSNFSKFLWSAAIVKIDFSLRKRLHNFQTNNCMMSPVSISLNIVRIFEEYQAVFIVLIQF